MQLSAAPATTLPDVLVAGTYGRGIWQIPLSSAGTQLTTATTQPASLAFGSQPVGTSSSAQAVTLANTGGIALVVTSISSTANFSETDNCVNTAVNAGSNCAIQATFTPGLTDNVAGQLTINANVSGGQIVIPLSGAGTISGLVTALPGMLNFGQVQLGTTSSALPVTVENAGSTSVAVTSVTVSAPFALAANPCGSALAANSDCALSLTFSPTQAGAATGTLTLADGAGVQTVALTGTGATAATDALSSTSLTFPATASGQQSASQAITLTNNGDLPLTSIVLTVSGSFQQSNTCGTQLTGHASCAISIVFAPSATGNISGNLTVSDAIHTQTIGLSGTGLQPPAISVTPAQLVFSAQPVGQAASPLALTIGNAGGAPMSNIGFQISGPSAAGFSWSASTCRGTLNGGSSCTIQVNFVPATPGQLVATLIVTSSTMGVDPVQVPLSGIGQAASGIMISPAQMLFTEGTLGQVSAAQTAIITNTSGVAASGLALSVSPPFSLVQNNCASALGAGTSCSTGVVFAPSANGIVTGALTVTSSAFVAAATASLTGTGGAAGSIQVQPASLSFATTGVGLTGTSQTVTFTNNGLVALADLALSPSSQFKLGLTTCSTSLATGASCTAQLAFSPSNAGQQIGSLSVSSSALATPAQVPLSGMGLDFTVSSTGQSGLTVSSGQTAIFTIDLATMSGSNGTFTFACSSLPANSACTFNPTSEAVSANTTGTVTAQIATGLSSTSARNIDHSANRYSRRALVFACGLLFLPIAFRRRLRGTLLAAIPLLFAFAITSCAGAGGGGGGVPPPNPTNTNTPAGTYSVVVTATANGLSHKITLSLTVD